MERPEDGVLIPGRGYKHFPVIYRGDSLAIIRRKILAQIKSWGGVGYYESAISTCAAYGRSTLTESEINVLELMAREYSINEAASELGKSIKTIYTQKRSAMLKLRLKNSHELRLFIIRHRRMLTLF
ncbi:hypothetical protein EGH57_21150 [Klebsiella aerogenes]|nr:hypothetical protein EGH57_21150 [Klebsiella aerogenes]